MQKTISFLIFLCWFSHQLIASEWQPLFNGQNLDGWTALPGGQWEVSNGLIRGLQNKSEKRHGILLSEQEFSDFEVQLEYKALKGNSGFYFRAKRVKHAVSIKGFQAEVDSLGNSNGGLYETLGRSWVVKVPNHKVKTFYKAKDWNQMTVRAVGRHVQVWVNGVKTAELKNDRGFVKGHFGLQLHGSQDMDVYFKNIRIKDLSKVNDAGTSHLTRKIHDKSVPLPPIKQPLSAEVLNKEAKAPANAIVLFDGQNTNAWTNAWPIISGSMQSAKGNNMTKQSFSDCHLHLEWKVVDPNSTGNSGVYLQGIYEVQILNSFKNKSKIYADGQAAAIYGQYPPAFNVCRPIGEWEYYDIYFKAARFDPSGKLSEKARLTVRHNGILVHQNAELVGPTAHTKRPGYRKIEKGPVMLQDHKDKVLFRNIWIVPQ